jgi:hypothetical protein
MKPAYERNKKYVIIKTGEFKKMVKPKFYIEITKLTPDGKPPCPRYQHSTTFIQQYLVIYGGRNDDMYQEIRNVALNDLHLYDLTKN